MEQLRGLPDFAQQQILNARQLQRENRQLARDRDASKAAEKIRMEQEQERARSSGKQATTERINAFLEATAPSVFAKHGLPLTQASATLVQQQFASIFRADGNAEITAADLEEAVIATKEYLGEQRASHAAAARPPARPGALPPRAGAAPAPTPAAAQRGRPGQQERGKISDLMSLINRGQLR
jgi:hypothetical protein